MWREWRELLRTEERYLNWKASLQFRRTANFHFAKQNADIRSALRHSNALLNPLCDPLEIDIGTHRWLSGQREESYSAWLAWVIEQIQDSGRILSLFGINDTADYPGPISTCIEEPVLEGHEGKSGRMDIVVTANGRRFLGVEVKLGPADVADTIKQSGYSKAFSKSVFKVLLAKSGKKNESEGRFKLRRWDDLCVQLRRETTRLTNLNLIQRAVMLGFVGAVEQNILGYPGNLRERIRRKDKISLEVKEYLLKSQNDGENNEATS
jgi:hypothetical protein